MEYLDNQSVVADFYQLMRIGGKFVTENKVLIRKGAKVLFGYANSINEDSHNNGKLYVIDHEATNDRYSKQKENNKAREAKSKLENVSAMDILKAVTGASNNDNDLQ